MVLVMLGAMVLSFTWGCGSGDSSDSSTPLPIESLTLEFTQIASGLASPTTIVHAGDGSDRLFVVEQGGQVRLLRNGVLIPSPFLNITDQVVSSGEQGLLGLAFPPGYAEKGYFYVDYTRALDGATVISRFHLSTDPDIADPLSEEVLLVVPQPFTNHNGGQLAFGPDGMLYVALGDGGSGGDPQGNAQDPATLLGNLLRIDVEAGAILYQVPPDNPFVADPVGRNEIWATGLRNPWRFSFDRLTGDLFIGDVGQGSVEEIDFQAATTSGGANYGWNILEGPDCFNPADACIEPSGYVPPVAFYDHTLGCSVTGGFVYRGPGNPDMQGLYFYGDFCSGRIWGLRSVGNTWDNQLITQTTFSISSFGEDEAGRLYLADYSDGTIYRIDQL
jgi:glucose/arabinose dehydrogenase